MDRDPGDQRRASLRASDADRERFVEALRQHHAEGRLTAEELEERAGRAYAARTYGDLDALTTDLPPLGQPPARPAAGPGRPAGSGPPSPRPGRDREGARAAFQRQLLMFALIAAMLVAIWALTNFGGYFWPIWPMLGFAIALAWQAFSLFSPQPPGDRGRDRRPGNR
jgi:uncharacterized protein DUF1707/2TM domain-containing protein